MYPLANADLFSMSLKQYGAEMLFVHQIVAFWSSVKGIFHNL